MAPIYNDDDPYIHTNTLTNTELKSVLGLGRLCGQGTGHYVCDEIIAECASDRDTVDVATAGAEVRVGKVVEHHESHQKEG